MTSDHTPSPARQPTAFSARDIIGSIVVVLIALTCVRLGIWQLHRLAEKRQRNAAAHTRMDMPPLKLSALSLDSAGLTFRRAQLSGTYDDEHTVVVAGRTLNAAPGVYVLTPLRVGNAGIYVNRGWLPSADAASVDVSKNREIAPDSLVGLIVEFSRDPRTDRDTTAGFKRVWYHLNHDALQKKLPYQVANYVVQLLPSRGDPALPKRVPPPEFDEGPHLGYAIQWFSFAVIGVVGWVILLARSRRRAQ